MEAVRSLLHSAIAIAVASGFAAGVAGAHEAPSGWVYPWDCCSDRDCKMIDAVNVSERPQGYLLHLSGETLDYTDPRVRNSPDGAYHWCAHPGTPRTICLFVPPPGS